MAQRLAFVKNEKQAEKQAERRANKYQKKDPFPSIKTALLSSSNISDYVRVTAMLHPFYPENLKSASYEAHAGGEFILWDENDNQIKKNVQIGETLTLPANSISFIQVEPYFRLPDYIALRFNLRITHVHRGLLLGTGPLIDPGFRGRLLIPLHNLTSSDYHIDTNDALIWVEFTKTTFGIKPEEPEAAYPKHIRFPKEKWDLSPDKYLHKASQGNPIVSSIGGVIKKASDEASSARLAAENSLLVAEQVADKARETASATQFRITIGAALAILALVLALAAISFDIKGLIVGTQEVTSAAVGEIGNLSVRIERATIEAKNLSRMLDVTIKGNAALQGRLREIEGKKLSERLDAMIKANMELQRRLRQIETQIEQIKNTMPAKKSSEP